MLSSRLDGLRRTTSWPRPRIRAALPGLIFAFLVFLVSSSVEARKSWGQTGSTVAGNHGANPFRRLAQQTSRRDRAALLPPELARPSTIRQAASVGRLLLDGKLQRPSAARIREKFERKARIRETAPTTLRAGGAAAERTRISLFMLPQPRDPWRQAAQNDGTLSTRHLQVVANASQVAINEYCSDLWLREIMPDPWYTWARCLAEKWEKADFSIPGIEQRIAVDCWCETDAGEKWQDM